MRVTNSSQFAQDSPRSETEDPKSQEPPSPRNPQVPGKQTAATGHHHILLTERLILQRTQHPSTLSLPHPTT